MIALLEVVQVPCIYVSWILTTDVLLHGLKGLRPLYKTFFQGIEPTSRKDIKIESPIYLISKRC